MVKWKDFGARDIGNGGYGKPSAGGTPAAEDRRGGFLAVKCENAFSGALRLDNHGRLLTIKENPETHGFGLKLMSAAAERYHSIMDVSYSDRVFTVQTALQLPKKKQLGKGLV
jgi:hypothetical protein